MLNQFVGVGRLVQGIELIEEGEKKKGIIKLAIPRSFKNENGEYDTDIIECVLWGLVAQNTADYCRKGDLVGVKGRIQTIDDKMVLVAEKITFLSSSRKEEEE